MMLHPTRPRGIVKKGIVKKGIVKKEIVKKRINWTSRQRVRYRLCLRTVGQDRLRTQAWSVEDQRSKPVQQEEGAVQWKEAEH